PVRFPLPCAAVRRPRGPQIGYRHKRGLSRIVLRKRFVLPGHSGPEATPKDSICVLNQPLYFTFANDRAASSPRSDCFLGENVSILVIQFLTAAFQSFIG